MRSPLIVACLALLTLRSLHAQKGAVFSPTMVSYGLGTAWQPHFTTGFGITSTAQVSFLDFLSKGMEVKTGFKVRDIFGGHCHLGYLSYADVQEVGGYVVSRQTRFWYDVGFDWAGLQLLYGFNEETWLSLKGQMAFSWNSAAYYDSPFPYGYSTAPVCAGVQVGPFSMEIGKGWEPLKHKPANYFTLASAFRFNEKNTTYNLAGFRFTSHREPETARFIDGEFVEEPFQKSFLLNIFYAHCI